MPAPRAPRNKKKPAGDYPSQSAGRPRRPRRSASRAPAHAPQSDDPRDRLQKVLAAAGVASRRECEQLIQEGRVEVDGQVVSELGVRVDPYEQAIRVDGEALHQPKRVYFAVNKPEGVVCTARDPSGRPRVTDLLPPEVGRVFNVGRLDLASEGLILVTNDGQLANELTHPRHGVEKTYHVQVAGQPTVETLAQLRKGVRLAEGKMHFVHARIKSRRKNSTVLEVVLNEGRNREIRRLLAKVDHKVQRLTRIAVGPVRLGEMPAGAYRPLTPQEIKALRETIATGGSKSNSTPTSQGKSRPASAAGRSPSTGGSRKASPSKGNRTSPPNNRAKKSAAKKPAGKAGNRTTRRRAK